MSEATGTSHNNHGSLPEPEEPNTRPDRSSPNMKTRDIKQNRPIWILLLGPTGSGKSSFINAVCDEKAPVGAPDSGPCTSRFRYHIVNLPERIVRLVDSPGFGGLPNDSSKLLKELMLYLSDRQSLNPNPRRLSGILYLHPEADSLDCDNLKHNINALKIILGERWLPRLKIIVMPKQNESVADPNSITSLQDPSSPFGSVHAAGAEILALPPRSDGIRNLLASYASLQGQLLDIQIRMIRKRIHVGRYIDGILLQDVSKSPTAPPPRPGRSGNHTSNRSVPTELNDAVERSQHMERALAEYEIEIQSLRGQLEQTRSDYASLRSELQINDNAEQNKLVQLLQSLNRGIEDFGRHTAKYVVDRHFDSDSDDHITLKAFNLSEIKAAFHHYEGNPSLVMSATGEGMQTEDFFDFATRSIVCKRLQEDMFLPFHPGLGNTPNNAFIQSLYETIRKQEHPTIASKWRANAFLGLCEADHTNARIKSVQECVRRTILQDICHVFSNFFDGQTTISLSPELQEKLGAIIEAAWGWNYTLKGQVVTLGDFRPTVFRYTVPFDPNVMADFEPNRKKSSPQHALCTVGLGLASFRSKAKGTPLNETIICKASVVTERVYE